MLSYLGSEQQTVVPFLPFRGENELKLVYRKMMEATTNGQSMSNESVFQQMSIDWNTNHVSVKDRIYPKMPIHFIKHLKHWRKNQDRRDAEIMSGSRRLTDVLEYVPEASNNVRTFQPTSFAENLATTTETTATAENLTTTTETTTTPNDPTVQTSPTAAVPAPPSPATETPIVGTGNLSGMQLLCRVCSEAVQPKKRRRKTCQGYNDVPCPEPETCAGSGNNENCVLITGGDESKKVKRKIVKKTERRCGVCKQFKCKGLGGKKYCPNKPT